MQITYQQIGELELKIIKGNQTIYNAEIRLKHKRIGSVNYYWNDNHISLNTSRLVLS